MWWNFVSSSRERIESAKRDWKDGRFAKVVVRPDRPFAVDPIPPQRQTHHSYEMR